MSLILGWLVVVVKLSVVSWSNLFYFTSWILHISAILCVPFIHMRVGPYIVLISWVFSLFLPLFSSYHLSNRSNIILHMDSYIWFACIVNWFRCNSDIILYNPVNSFVNIYALFGASLVAQWLRTFLPMQETGLISGGQEGSGRSLREGNGNPLLNILAWEIPWTEESTVHGVSKESDTTQRLSNNSSLFDYTGISN